MEDCMGDMAKTIMPRGKSLLFANVLVLFPGIYAVCLLLYFNVFTGIVPLPTVLPFFLYLALPVNVLSIYFAVLCILHLFRSSSMATGKTRTLWLLSFLILTGVSLPVYWYRHVATEPEEG